MTRNEYISKLIGASLGKVKEAELEEGAVEWGEFMRIQVHIDITKLLLWCKKLNIGLPEPVWVSSSYERLPEFCFCCGILGHNHKACTRWLYDKEMYD